MKNKEIYVSFVKKSIKEKTNSETYKRRTLEHKI